MRAIYLLVAFLPSLAFGQFVQKRAVLPRSSGARASTLPNSVGCFGDSIMAGACSGRSPCARVGDGIPGSLVTQWAVGGYTAQQIRDRYLNDYATACLGEECGTILVQGGVNSLKAGDAQTGVVEANTLATMREIVTHALGRGRRVVWVGVLPYGSCTPDVCPILVDAGLRARAYNTLMAAACAEIASPNLRCVSPYETFESDLTPDALDSSYACSDGIHLQDHSGKTGSQTLAAGILDALGY